MSEHERGRAEPDPDQSGRLRVSFLPAALRWIPCTRADYWVLKLDEARRQGYELEGWIRPSQSGARVTDAQLELSG